MASPRSNRRLLPRAAGLALALSLAGCAAGTVPPPVSRAPAQCLAELDRLGVQYQLEPIPASAKACTIDNPVRVTAMGAKFQRSVVMSCDFALHLDRFEHEVLDPEALRFFGFGVHSLLHFGTYACRKTKTGKESEHALGKAIDLAGIELDDGTVILVEKEWHAPGKKRAFLHAVAQQACHYFSEVLSPDSDADHYNHLHLDTGPYKLCIKR
jgi:hypothetical protein